MAMTLYYQPPAYWDGDRSQLIEANPLVWLALRLHPALLIPGCIAWYVLFWFLIFRTPAWIGLRCLLVWTSGHLIAITGWLVRCHPQGVALSVLLYLIAVPIGLWLYLPLRSQWNSCEPIETTRKLNDG